MKQMISSLKLLKDHHQRVFWSQLTLSFGSKKNLSPGRENPSVFDWLLRRLLNKTSPDNLWMSNPDEVSSADRRNSFRVLQKVSFHLLQRCGTSRHLLAPLNNRCSKCGCTGSHSTSVASWRRERKDAVYLFLFLKKTNKKHYLGNVKK